MRLIRDVRRFDCETQRRRSRRSLLRKWLALSHSEDDQCVEDYKQQEVLHGPFSLCITRRTVSPLTPSLKKAQSPLAVRWSSCIEAFRLRDNGNAQRRVRFAEREEECSRPIFTTEEKALYHYSAEELENMAAFASQSVHRESRFAGQPKGTILEQGFLSLPVHAPFVQSKRYYCLLRGHQIQMYSSAAHAAKNSGLKGEITILRAQDCETLSMKKKFALFGASMPAQLSLMFYVIKANGERIIFTADTKSSKCNWVHSLTQVTYVGEKDNYTALPPIRSRSSSAPTKFCNLSPVPEVETDEEIHDNVTAVSKSDRRNSCFADYR
ncbi:putative pleckstrin domain, PH-like domain superfamily [Plasmopara halstedii]